MRAITAFGFALISFGGMGAGMAGAAAADFALPAPPVYSEPDAQFEFGTGWYLRGDVGYSDASRQQLISDLPTLTSSTDWTGDIGAGYRWNNWFRTDLTLNFDGIQNTSQTVGNVTCVNQLSGATSQVTGQGVGYFWTPNLGTCDGHNRATILKNDVMVSGYVDLGTYAGLTPYVGGGVGFSRIDYWQSTNYTKTADGSAYNPDLTPTGGFPLLWVDQYGNNVNPTVPTTGLPVAFAKQNWTKDKHVTQYNFAWSLTGGVAYALDDHLSIDASYRYVNLGTIRDASGRERTIDANQVRLGLIYAID